MLRVSLRNVTGRFATLLLTALAVVLGTAFVAGSLVFTDSIQRTFEGLGGSGGTSDATVRGVEGSGSTGFGDGRVPLPLDLREDIEGVDGVRAAQPQLFGSALLVGADGTAVRNSNAPAFGQAYEDESGLFEVVDGRAPEGPDEVAVESGTLERSGLAVGDETRVVAGQEPVEVTVVGEVEQSVPTLGSTLVLFDEETAQSYFAPDGTVSTFTVLGDGSLSQDELVDALEPVLPDTAEALTAEQLDDEFQEDVGSALGFVNTFLLVVGGVALLVGAFIIFNVFSMLLARRTRELALLRAVGASSGQVLGAVVLEAVVVGLVGSLAGLGLGVLIALALKSLVGLLGFEIGGGLPVDATTVTVALLTGVLVTLVAAILPAVRASRVAPVAALRDEVALPERQVRLRAVAGLALAGLGVAALLAGLFADVPQALLFVGLGVLAMFLGIAIAAPAIARPVVWLISAPGVALFGAVGRLARQNSLRNPRRTAATATSLMIGVALVGAALIVASSISASVADAVEDDLRADYVLSGGQQPVLPTSVADRAGQVDGVELVVPTRTVLAQVLPEGTAAAEAPPGTEVEGAVQEFTLAADLPDLSRAVALDVVAGDPEATGDVVAVQRSTAEANGWEVGDALLVAAGVAGPREFTVALVYEDAAIPGTALVLPAAVYDEATPAAERADSEIFVLAEEGADLAALRADLTELVEPYLVVSVLDGEEYTDQAQSFVSVLLGVIAGLVGLSILVAVIGIVITLVLSVVERRREIGLLRAVGLTQVQLRRAVTLEGVATSVFGALLGIALGIVFGLALQRALEGQGIETLSVPWLSLAAFVLGGAVVGIVAAAVPAWWASRRDVLASIASA